MSANDPKRTLIQVALDKGINVSRRPDADPFAVLGVSLGKRRKAA
jgi:hypothetical protein